MTCIHLDMIYDATSCEDSFWNAAECNDDLYPLGYDMYDVTSYEISLWITADCDDDLYPLGNDMWWQYLWK